MQNKSATTTTVEMININDFPDEILTHILHFLPFKQAFRTTILSKRWRPLPPSLADLNINDEGVKDTNDWFRFRQFMNKVIFSPHSQHLQLTSFHLYYRFTDELSDYSTFNQWIEAAKQRSVKRLSLYLFRVPLTPSTIFCCKTLVDVKLTGVSVTKMALCSVDLPLLNHLYMSNVCFNDMEDLMILIYGCPILETLKTSSIFETGKGVTVGGGGYLKPLSKLIKADIHLSDVPLTNFSNVQFLTISQFKMGTILENEEINSYYKGFPVFGNLIDLQLLLHRGMHDWNEIVKILQNCPILQTLLIFKGLDLTTKEDWKYPSHVPECVSSHLTSCEIIGYEAFEADFQFETYILQNARLLQVMTISHTFCLKPFESSQYLEDLSSCQRISPACELYIYNSKFQRIYPLI